MRSSSKSASTQIEELQKTAQLLTTSSRLTTFKRFGYSRRNEAFSPQFRFSLAYSGWFSPDSKESPSSVKCPFCLLEMEIQSDDDAWLQHKMNSKNCEFVRIGKLDEATWTLQEAIALATRCAAGKLYTDIVNFVENLEDNEENAENSAEMTKTLIEVRDKSTFLTYEHRLATFEDFIYDKDPSAKCTSENLARSGWFSTANKRHPNTAKCPFCLMEVEFDAIDDPWEEHKKFSEHCDFVKLNNMDETTWDMDDALKLSIRCAIMIKYGKAVKFGEDLEDEDEIHNQLKTLLSKPKLVSRRMTIS